MGSTENISAPHLWSNGSVYNRHRQTASVHVRDYEGNGDSAAVCLWLPNQVIFKPVSSRSRGVRRLTHHLLALYSDQICSTWHWTPSQWDSWVLVTTLQCFINRDSCVIHLPGPLAVSHVMAVDRSSYILDWDFCPGKFSFSLILGCPRATQRSGVEILGNYSCLVITL